MLARKTRLTARPDQRSNGYSTFAPSEGPKRSAHERNPYSTFAPRPAGTGLRSSPIPEPGRRRGQGTTLAKMQRRSAAGTPAMSRPRAVADPIPPATRLLLRARSGGICELCGVLPAESAHHRLAKGMGGSSAGDRHSLEKLLHTCGLDNRTGCHGACHTHRHRYRNGWAVRHGVDVDPANIPVLYRGQWVLLTPSGGVAAVAAP